MLYFCAKVKEIFSKIICSLDFFGSFFYQEKNEHNNHDPQKQHRIFFYFIQSVGNKTALFGFFSLGFCKCIKN